MSPKRKKAPRKTLRRSSQGGGAGLGRLHIGVVVGRLLTNPTMTPQERAVAMQLVRTYMGTDVARMTDDDLLASYQDLHADGWLRVKDGVAYLSSPDNPQVLAPMGTMNVVR